MPPQVSKYVSRYVLKVPQIRRTILATILPYCCAHLISRMGMYIGHLVEYHMTVSENHSHPLWPLFFEKESHYLLLCHLNIKLRWL